MSISIAGVACASYEEGLAHLRAFSIRPGLAGYNYALLMMKDDGSYHLVERLGMPCFGALREYNCGTRPNDPWPYDLRDPRHIFPKEGSLVAVCVQFKRNGYSGVEAWNSWIEDFAFNVAVSPWKSVLNGFELYKMEKDGAYGGVVLTDTDVDPTVFVNLLRVCGRAGSEANWFKFMNEHKGVDPRVAFVKTYASSYSLKLQYNLKALFTGQPFNFSDGVSLRDRGSYNRPDNEKIFLGNEPGVVGSQLSIDELNVALKEALA